MSCGLRRRVLLDVFQLPYSAQKLSTAYNIIIHCFANFSLEILY